MQESVKRITYATDQERVIFFKKTYTHVAWAILAFIGVESLLVNFVPESFIIAMVSKRWIWLLILGGFWLASMLAQKWSLAQDRTTQYMGLGFYVIIEAIIFLPMIYIALAFSDPNVINQAAIITLALFAGLTAMVFFTKIDFSFLRYVLIVGGFVSLGLIIAGAIFGFNLGLWFSGGMVLLASGSILYQTYQLKADNSPFTTDKYVGAALLLFASVMLLFWYILQILLSKKD
ncbi:MAG: Bax inhibitor-1 family protein [Capnocytophaga sp.]|nr:Bax inhibitor-1 family protein [Capnocytophaga sp.]